MGKNKHAKNLDEASSSDLVQEPEGWKEPEMTKDDNPHGLLAESSFSTLFPKYREKYLQEVWPLVERDLHKYNLKGELDLVEGSMTVKTTRKTWDPYAILNARDMITLLARFVPYEQATKIFENDVACDIIKISNLVPKKDRFIKRRQRLIGPNGTTLKAIEMLTNCYVLIQGKTVAVMGSHKGLSQVRKIVMDCMKNIHPIYDIKSLMIQQELAKDPALQNESWDRFLPKYKPKHESKRRKPMKIRQKGEYTPFPPAPPESKIDRELASGEYFLKDSEKEAKKRAEKWEKERASSSGTSKRKAEKAQEYIAPDEQPSVPKKAKTEESSEVDIGSLKTKIKKAMKHKKKKHKKNHDMEQPV